MEFIEVDYTSNPLKKFKVDKTSNPFIMAVKFEADNASNQIGIMMKDKALRYQSLFSSVTNYET